MDKKFIVDGFEFETVDEYTDAKKEAEAIAYIRTKTDLNNTTMAIKVYNNLVEKQTFITPVGTSFLKELYDKILKSGVISKENLRPVLIKKVKKKQNKEIQSFKEEGELRIKKQNELLQLKLKKSKIICFFLLIIVIAMFGLTMFGKNSPLIDAEIRIQNKYASWSQELSEREARISEREQELGITK